MEKNKDKERIIFKRSLVLWDAFYRTAEEFFIHSYFTDATRDIDNAVQQIINIDEGHPEAIARRGMIKGLEGSISAAQGNYDTAQMQFNESIALLTSIIEQDQTACNPLPLIDEIKKKLEGISMKSSPQPEMMEIESTDDVEAPIHVAKKPKACKIPPKKAPGRKASTEKKYKCTWEGCSASFGYSHHLTRHINTKHLKIKEPPVNCQVEGCNASFSNANGLRAHMRAIHEKITFKCTVCHKQFTSKASCNHHMAKFHGVGDVKKFQCEHCLKDFARHRNMRGHVSTVHAGERRHKCPTCKNLFTQKQGLKEHMQAVHEKVEMFECNFCQMKFLYRATLRKHTKPRSCTRCLTLTDFRCSKEFNEHRQRHTFTCITCSRSDCKFGRAHHHSQNSHIKLYDCPKKPCNGKFCSKYYITSHLIHVHGMWKCLMCPACFDDESLMLAHCKKDHQQLTCVLCTGIDVFMYFTHKQLADHIISVHKDFLLCRTCGRNFNSNEGMLNHDCSGTFNADDLKMLSFLRQPLNLDALDNSPSLFANDEGLIADNVPVFPPKSNIFFNPALNVDIDRKDYPLYLNQDQRLIQCGATAVLCRVLELNSLAWVIEVIEWPRSNDGALLDKPKFSREGMHFKRDSNDTIYDIRTSTLEYPFHMGHARAAGNCFTELDFRASFTNMNYWPMHATLNSNYWRNLESHIRLKAKGFAKVYVLTGAIFIKDGKVVSNYIKGVYVPPAFFKLAVFEDFEEKLELQCWIMQNDGSRQPVDESEVSVLLLERATRTKFFTKATLDRIHKDCIMKHKKDLRRHDNILGIK